MNGIYIEDTNPNVGLFFETKFVTAIQVRRFKNHLLLCVGYNTKTSQDVKLTCDNVESIVVDGIKREAPETIEGLYSLLKEIVKRDKTKMLKIVFNSSVVGGMDIL